MPPKERLRVGHAGASRAGYVQNESLQMIIRDRFRLAILDDEIAGQTPNRKVTPSNDFVSHRGAPCGIRAERRTPVSDLWTSPLDDYLTELRASGRSKGTCRLRRCQLLDFAKGSAGSVGGQALGSTPTSWAHRIGRRRPGRHADHAPIVLRLGARGGPDRGQPGGAASTDPGARWAGSSGTRGRRTRGADESGR